MSPDSDWLKYQSEQIPDNLAVVQNSIKLTYSELNQNVNNAANRISSEGISSGNYVPVIMAHQFELIVMVYGLWRIGAVPVLLSPHLTSVEYDAIFSKLESNFCVVVNSIDYKNDKLKFVNAEFNNSMNTGIKSQWIGVCNKPALILFTSGSEGASKGVVISFASLFNSFMNISNFDEYTASDKFLASLPFHHIGGFSIIIRALLSGGQIIIPDNVSYKAIAEGMKQHDPSIISLIPTNLKRLIENDVKPNNSLRSLYLGGGPSSYNLIDDATRMKYPLIKVYGSTETCSMVSAIKVKNSSEYNSSGRALKNSNFVIHLQDQIEIDGRLTGEVLINSDSLFSGYLNDDDLTKKKLSDGYYHTGDYGYIDTDGLLYIIMRREDLIISGGENINPYEIQYALNSIEGINESSVVGIEDEEWGQISVAFIVCNYHVTDGEIINRLKKILAPYKIPKQFVQVDSLPKNELGKLSRQAILKLIRKDV